MTVAANVIATATPVATATPSATPTPTVTPEVVVHAATNPDVLTQVLNYVNHVAATVPPHEIVLAGGVLAVVMQYFLNKFRFLGNKSELWVSVYNWVISVALPFALTGFAALLADGSIAKYGAWVYLAAQVLYATGKKLLEKAQTKTVEATPEVPAF